MAFDREQMARLVALHGRVVRVVVADAAGSSPREVGAAMCVWATGQDGTIGGGALEHQATVAARAMLAVGAPARLDRLALGPALNQCCGGAVTLLSECWDQAALSGLNGAALARPLPGRGAAGMPLAASRLLARARDRGQMPATGITQGWFIEAFHVPRRQVWIWGAGHVGRAIVATLAPLPDLHLTWVDTDAGRFPPVPAGVTQRVAANPALLVPEAPLTAEHLILTFSHALDLDLCHRLLAHGFAGLGLIGSGSKWARFRSRLIGLGHAPDRVGRIVCPIGDPHLGKHPQAIAIGVAGALLNRTKDRVALHDPADEPATGGIRQ